MTKFLSQLSLAFACVLGLRAEAQTAQSPAVAEVTETVMIDGQVMERTVSADGDTTYIASSLIDVSVSSPRKFGSPEEYKRYLKYRYYAPKVYPYAVQAIRIFRETEYVTANMSERKAKRHVKRLQKELDKEFEEPLKKLTKTQGFLLVKMIEKETGEPMHELIKDLRGGVTATYWTTMGKMVGYDLKDGYVVGADTILDIVLQDYNVSHVVVDGERLEREAEAEDDKNSWWPF